MRFEKTETTQLRRECLTSACSPCIKKRPALGQFPVKATTMGGRQSVEKKKGGVEKAGLAKSQKKKKLPQESK